MQGFRIPNLGFFKLPYSEIPIKLVKAYLLISCEIGQEQSIYSQLSKIPEIKFCLITYGNYDIVAEFETASSYEMNEVISSKIRQLENIRSTITLRVTD
jgi:DNA-binding Lrp family transcriptional regulator